MSDAPQLRLSVRVLLLDEQDRLLLFRAEDPDTGNVFWFPTGGGLEDGEDVRRHQPLSLRRAARAPGAWGSVHAARHAAYGYVIREVTRSGEISTVVGQDPNCRAVLAAANDIPARFAQVTAAELTIGPNGLLDLMTGTCPGAPHQGGYVQLTRSGRLVPTVADSIPNVSAFCGGGVQGSGFTIFQCESGNRRGPRLMVVRSNGSIRTYPDHASQADFMSTSNGTVVVSHNLAIVKITAAGSQTLATERQIAHLVPGAIGVMGEVDIAINRHGTVYAVESVLARPHGCTSMIVQVSPGTRVRALWRSAPNQTCF